MKSVRNNYYESVAYLALSSALSAAVPIALLVIYSNFDQGLHFSKNSLTLSIAGIFSLVIDAGLHQLYVMRSSAKKSWSEGRILTAFLVQRIASIIFCILCMSLWTAFTYQSELVAIWWMALGVGALQALQPIWWFNANHAHGSLLKINVAAKVGAICVFVWAASGWGRVMGPVLAVAAGHLVMSCLMVSFIIRRERTRARGFTTVYPSMKVITGYFLGRVGSALPASGASAYVGFFDISLAGVIAFAELIYKTIRLSVSPVIQVATTRYLATTDKLQELIFLIKNLFVVNIVAITAILLVGKVLIGYFLPAIKADEQWIILCYGVAGVVSTASSFLGFPAYAAIGRYNEANLSLIFASFGAVLSFFALNAFGVVWVSLAVLVFEVLLIICRVNTIWTHVTEK